VLLAVALGLDVSCRIALACTLDRGWHRTAAIGVFGAAAAAGKLIGLTPEQMLAAFGIAYSQAAGNRQCILDGALTKVGYAVHKPETAGAQGTEPHLGHVRVADGQIAVAEEPLQQQDEEHRHRAPIDWVQIAGERGRRRRQDAAESARRSFSPL
jgi:2-methylcitrate dehydratase PrpD